MGVNVILPLIGGLAVLAGVAVFVMIKNRTAYLGPVKEELQKEKAWLRRGEYNAAMVKGRQNLELLLKLVAEKNGIQLDNSAKAQADAKEEAERRNQELRGGNSGRGGKKRLKVMTYQQFNRWLSDNGYLDRVARWEMNQVRVIGNKAVHEGYADKDDATNQFNYLEDILKTITEKSQNPKKRQVQEVSRVKDGEGQKKQDQGQKKQEAASETVKKKRRRRRKKKAQTTQTAQTAETAVTPSEPKTEKKTKPKVEKKVEKKAEPKAEKKTEKKAKTPSEPKADKKPETVGEVEKKPNAHKRRRRRRKKPQTAQDQQTVNERASNSSGE